MIWVKNTFGQDPADFNDDRAAYRIGQRIRKIREARHISIADLARQIGTSADMLQKYENGQRKPKTDRLKDIAYVLNVSSLALTDPVITSYVGAMFALFELEEKHNMSLIEQDGKVYMTFSGIPNHPLNDCLRKWYKEKESVRIRMEGATEKEKELLQQEYNDWEWTFPDAISWKPSRRDKEREKEALEKRLKELTEELKNEDK